jgi:hypothetical protein
MNIGMLWFDNDIKSDLPTKIQRASDYYRNKYGRTPNVCFVHPSMLPAPVNQAAGVELRTSRSVLPNHLWLGISAAQ